MTLTREIKQPYRGEVLYLQVLLVSLGLLGFEVVSYLPELLGVDSRVVTVPYRGVYVVLCMVGLFYFIWRHSITIPRDFYPVLLFWLFYFIRACFDTFFHIEDIKMSVPDFWLYAFVLSFFPMLPLLARVNLKTMVTVKKAVFAMAIFLNLMSIVYNYTFFSNPKMGRLGANLILNSITTGQLGGTLIIISLTYLGARKGWQTLALLLLMVLGLSNLGLAASRGPVIQLGVALLVFLLLNLKRISFKNLGLLAAGSFGLAMYFSDYVFLYNSLIRRLQSTGLSQSGYDELRYILFTGAWEQFLSHPILGDFIEGRVIGGYPHNIFLEALMALGMVGGGLMTYIFVLAIRNSLRLMRLPVTNWLGCLLIMQLVAQITSGSIYQSFALWSLIAFAAAVVKNIHLYGPDSVRPVGAFAGDVDCAGGITNSR